MKAMRLKSPFLLLFLFLFTFSFSLHARALVIGTTTTTTEEDWKVGLLVKKDQRRSLVQTEYGEISAVDVSDGTRSGRYHLQFFTLDPNALFLPVLLHADMVLHVKTGSGRLYWSPGDEKVMTVSLQRGDVYRVPPGSIFFLRSDLQPEREKLRINAIFANANANANANAVDDDDLRATSIGAYSSIADMVRGFDKNILQAAFKAPEEVIEAMMSSSTPAIVHMVPPTPKLVHLLDWEISFLKAFGGARAYSESIDEKNKKKRKETRTFNVIKEDPDFKNCNGWSSTVTKSDLPSLKHSMIGVFYVNLTKGSMMGPHWNPKASEIAIVVEGQGMVRVVCASSAATNESRCKNMRFRVDEGDVFAVPRFHPMAQMSFNNNSLVLVGFSTTTKKTYPQFLAGKASVLQVLDKDVLAAAFRVTNTTIKQLLAPQEESIILDCTSCAEEEEMKMEEEIKKEEEEKRREEEKEREEEEARKREEEAKRREEEEAKKREEEREKREREEEEEREKEREEEEEAKKREEERERREREEEEEREREREEEERERREREEEEEEEREREREREEEKEREQEEARKQEEERERKQEEEEEREQEEARKQEEERERKQQKEERERQEEERRRQEEEATKREREEEEEETREKEGESEEEEARRQEKERARREQQEEEEMRRERERQEEARREEEGGGEGDGRRVLKKIWKV